MMPMLDFAHPHAFWLLPVWLLAMVALGWGMRVKRKRVTFWLSPEGATRWWRQAQWQLALFGAATLFLTLALARPRYFAGKVAAPSQGVDVVICLDVSHSMLCQDIKPSRLEFAQALLANFLERLQPSDRVGLVVFGGSGFPLCPLTQDRSIVQTYLNLIDPSVMVYNPTTYLAEGLRTSLKLLQRKSARRSPLPSPVRGGVILLLSDGEDQGSDYAQAANACAKARVPVFAIGIGTTKGAPVPEVTEHGIVRGYKRDLQGNIAVSKLMLEPLQFIARKTSGKVYTAIDTQREVAALLRDLSDYRERVWTRQVAQWRELFPLLLLVSALLLLAETWLGRGSLTEIRR